MRNQQENVYSNNSSEILSQKSNSAVIAHVEMMQGIINRLADNSAKCKDWCFTLIGALMVFIFATNEKQIFDIRILYYLTGIFCFLDAFYLGLERDMKKCQKRFIEKINEGKDVSKDIFLSHGSDYSNTFLNKFILQTYNTFKGLFSFSVVIPYGLLFFGIYLFKTAISHQPFA